MVKESCHHNKCLNDIFHIDECDKEYVHKYLKLCTKKDSLSFSNIWCVWPLYTCSTGTVCLCVCERE